jgi:flagellin
MNAARINSNPAYDRAISDHSRAARAGREHSQRLASGMRVNGGRDDGAHLSVSEGMRAELGGLTEGTRNTEKAMDLLRTAEGGLNEISAILLRMRELATQGSSDSLNDKNREAMDAEFNQAKEFIDRIARLSSYNDQNLLSGFGSEVDADLSSAMNPAADTGIRRVTLSSADTGTYNFVDGGNDSEITLGNGIVTQTVSLGSILDGDKIADATTVVVNFDVLGVEMVLAGDDVKGALGSYQDGDLNGTTLVVNDGTGGTFQLGSDAVAADRLEYDIKDMTIGAQTLDLNGTSVNTRDGSRLALRRIDEAINRVAGERGTMGATMNRLEYTLNFTERAIEGVTNSQSTIRDADYALESSDLAKNQILAQMSQAAMINSQVPVQTVMTLIAA